VYFFDTSALVKRYVAEVGSSTVIEIVADPGATLVVADVTRAECVSAFSRRWRAGDMSDEGYQTLKLAFAAHLLHDYLVVPLEPAHVTVACALIERHGLRAYDAIQLATGLAVKAWLGEAGDALRFVSADPPLTRAARAEGLVALEPVL